MLEGSFIGTSEALVLRFCADLSAYVDLQRTVEWVYFVPVVEVVGLSKMSYLSARKLQQRKHECVISSVDVKIAERILEIFLLHVAKQPCLKGF